MTNHVLRSGEASNGAFALDVTPESAGWTHSGLKVLVLEPGQTESFPTGGDEAVILSLSGAADVTVDTQSFHLEGRASVFDGPSDVVYAPIQSSVTITSPEGGRFAVCTARAENQLEPSYLKKSDVPVELRGAGQASRQVHNFGVPTVLEADRIIACEVLTPGGNWSSYPPHKHDVERAGETQLEEIYYFEIADGPNGPGMAYQRVYGHESSETDVLAEVRSGDVVLIPDGWHGPSIAVPGYDLYYLNVMAGGGETRAWLICDDPAHAWIRDTWAEQSVDPRLPLGGKK